ncbi:MAG TPA: excinuclease ABC subunit UvrA, partial [Verrucomicrobia bacterium]|nr:excinuclease ABC subunit UvrA [Verrucomicrobiota bacterium]
MAGDIIIKGAREHNLRGVDVTIPRDALTVVTGLSGSGKSSLAFDTLYAEGQRRYVESLSAYARQFLDRLRKPDVEKIEGLSPAISIEQHTTSGNPRSIVATVTEIHDYLRLLYGSIAVPHCPVCGREVQRQTAEQIVETIQALPAGKIILYAPVVRGKKGRHDDILAAAKRNGFARVRIDGAIHPTDELPALDKKRNHTIEIVVDRLVLPCDRARLTDSVELALREGKGLLEVEQVGGETKTCSEL